MRLLDKPRYLALQWAADLLALSLAWLLTLELRLALNPFMGTALSRGELRDLAPPLTVVLAVWAAAWLWVRGRTQDGSVGVNLLNAVESVFIAGVVTVVVSFFYRELVADLSRGFVILYLPISFATLLLSRYAALGFMIKADSRWPTSERMAVVGSARHAHRLVNLLHSRNLPVAGIITPSEPEAVPATVGAPVLGAAPRLAEIINREQLSRVIFASPGLDADELAACEDIAHRMGVTVAHALSCSPAAGGRHMDLGGVQLLELRPFKFTRKQEILKRIFDIVVAASTLLALAPLMIAISVAVRVTSPGPVFYRSRRVGRGGRYFTFLKFRSMYADGATHLALAQRNEKRGHIFKMLDDPRVTPLGRILRRYSLDELPQLINVLAGDMSLVGPRPLPSCDLQPDGMSRDYQLWSETRARVLPGITGAWQIAGRSDLDFDQMVALDLEYVETWSLGADLKILLQTPLVVLTGEGAY